MCGALYVPKKVSILALEVSFSVTFNLAGEIFAIFHIPFKTVNLSMKVYKINSPALSKTKPLAV